MEASRILHRRSGSQNFTQREKLVVDLLQHRLSNKEIGTVLKISERTVRFHLANIFSKLGVNDRYSVVDLARSRKRLEVTEIADAASPAEKVNTNSAKPRDRPNQQDR
jgi:DNA-binding NarL/FixJ family response regulator